MKAKRRGLKLRSLYEYVVAVDKWIYSNSTKINNSIKMEKWFSPSPHSQWAAGYCENTEMG